MTKPSFHSEQTQPSEKKTLNENLKNIIFVALLLGMLLIMFELVMRISYPLWFPNVKQSEKHMLGQLIDGQLESSGFFPTFQAHHYLSYTLAPNKRLPTGEIINAENGFRAPEMSKLKPAGTYRIVLLGGSITYDNGFSFFRTYAAYLEEALERVFPGRDIDVLNAAVGGYTSAECLLRFHFMVLDYDPDMVIISDGLSDVFPRLYSKKFSSDYGTARKIFVSPNPPSESQRRWMRYSFIFRAYYWFFKLHQRVPDLMQLIYSPTDKPQNIKTLNESNTLPYRRNLEDMIYIAKGRHIQPVLVTQALATNPAVVQPSDLKDAFVEGSRQHNEVMREVGRKLEVPVYGLDQTIPQTKGVFGDICHLNADGNRIKAYLVASEIIPFLQKKFDLAPANVEEPLIVNLSSLHDAVVHRRIGGKDIQISKELLQAPITVETN